MQQVNQARQALGLKPLRQLAPGSQNLSGNPLVIALEQLLVSDMYLVATDEASGDKIASAWETKARLGIVPLPEHLKLFMRAYRMGSYPHLVNHDESRNSPPED